VHHADADRLSGLLSLDDTDRLLTSSAIRTPALRLARDGAVLPESTYTRGGTLAGKPLTGLVDPRKALALFGEGATVVFQGLHRYWEPIADLVSALELELGHPCQANAYLTPPGAQGFAVHSDSHDVFVFQTHGSKQWEIHSEGAVEDLLMVPGLSVYLPTGTPHAARAQEEVSLHVTIGINQLTWRGLVERAVRPLLDEVDDGHLPGGYLEDPAELTAGLADRLSAVADGVRRLDPGTAAESEVERFLTTRNPRLRGGLADVLLAQDLDDRTPLRRRAGHPCVLRDRGDRLTVLLGDRSLEMPGWVREAMEVVRRSDELRPADLAEAGLDEASRLVLCRRLVREGLLGASG
jgi:bifunctional lysine-specific demethylase and histidyl-hydroxylase NO66